MGNFKEIPAGFVEVRPGEYEKPGKSALERQKDNRFYREPVKPRIRQSSKPLMNKLETQFQNEVLSKMYRDQRVVAQGMRVKIANGSWYKVDFFVPELKDAHEVKGPKVMKNQQSRQMLALKTAAFQWPEYRWFLHWFENGQWQQQLVKP